MKRWFTVLVVAVFAIAAVSLVVVQFYQMRRTISISDNMFNVAVGNAMDEVLHQLGGEEEEGGTLTYQHLDALVAEQLLLNGIDMHPAVGLYDGTQRSFLFSTDPSEEGELEVSPYRYAFQPVGVVSGNQFYIILAFSKTELFLQRNSWVYVYMTLFLVLIIVAMFFLSMRTLSVQRKLDRMKTQFINNMTHEIKTPLATISLACEMLQDPTVSQDRESQKNFISIVSDENHRLQVLVETLLQSAKMADKRYRITHKEVDLNRLMERVAGSFRLSLTKRNGTIDLQLAANPSTLMADEMHLTNLVFNLVDNGIKYSDGKPHIELSTRNVDGGIELRVQDHGMGIAKEDQKHVFERFYRVSTGDVHDVKGFGIGLSYVAEVVRLHRGTITLESEPGKGTTFIVTLPR